MCVTSDPPADPCELEFCGGTDGPQFIAPNNNPPCFAGVGPLQVGQSRCAPKMPKGSNIIKAYCNDIAPSPVVSGLYNVPGAPLGEATTSSTSLPSGGQCVVQGPNSSCYSLQLDNCGYTFCAANYVPFQQVAPGVYMPKQNANVVQTSTQCITFKP